MRREKPAARESGFEKYLNARVMEKARRRKNMMPFTSPVSAAMSRKILCA